MLEMPASLYGSDTSPAVGLWLAVAVTRCILRHDIDQSIERYCRAIHSCTVPVEVNLCALSPVTLSPVSLRRVIVLTSASPPHTSVEWPTEAADA